MRKHYADGTRKKAVGRVFGGETQAMVAREMGIPPSTLSGWVTKTRFVATIDALRGELRQLGKEIERLERRIARRTARIAELVSERNLSIAERTSLQKELTRLQDELAAKRSSWWRRLLESLAVSAVMGGIFTAE